MPDEQGAGPKDPGAPKNDPAARKRPLRVRQSTLVGMPAPNDAIEAVAKAKAAVAEAKAEKAAAAEAPAAEAPAAEAPGAAPAVEAPAPEPPAVDARAPTDPPPAKPEVATPKGDPLKRTQPLAPAKLGPAKPALPAAPTPKAPLKATQPMSAFKPPSAAKPSAPKSTEPLATEPTQAAAKMPGMEPAAKPPAKDAPLTPVAVPRSLGLQPKAPREVSSAGTHVEGLATRPRVRTLGPKSSEPLGTEPTQAAAKMPGMEPTAKLADPLAQTMAPETAEIAAAFGSPSRATATAGFQGPPPFETTAFESSPGLDGALVDELPGEPTHVGAQVPDELPTEATRPNVELPPEMPDEPGPTTDPPKELPVVPTVVVHPSVAASAQTYQVDMQSGVVHEVATITDAPPKKKGLPLLWIVVAGLVFLGFVGITVALITYVVLFVPRSGEIDGPTATSLPRTPETPAVPAPTEAAAPLPNAIPREEMEAFQLDRPRMSFQSVRMRPVQRRRAALAATANATRLTRAGSDAAAERAWRNVLGFTPADPDAFEGLGTVTARQHRYPEARAWAQLAVERAQRASAYRLLGDIWRDAGHPEEARLTYRAGLLRHPGDRQLQERAGP